MQTQYVHQISPLDLEKNTSFIQNLKIALNQNQPSYEHLEEMLNTVFSESMKGNTTLISPHFFHCQAKILTKLGRCGSEICNETELRYVLGDPIMEMLCTIFFSQNMILYFFVE